MNVMKQNGNTILVDSDSVVVNGTKYPKPKGVFFCNSITQINGELWVNGYKFKNGKFVKENVFVRLFRWLTH